MVDESWTFGRVVAEARKKLRMNQKSLAAAVLREDGAPITPQYLNDIEHDRRVPSSKLVHEFARVLEIDSTYLEYLAGRIPEDWRRANLTEEVFRRAEVAFRQSIGKPRR